MRRADGCLWVYAVCCCTACEWHNIDLDSGLNAADAAPISASAESCDGSQEYRCAGAEFQRCTSSTSGSSWVLVETCSDAESCGPIGGCLDRTLLCAPGQNVCVGPQLQSCGAGNFAVLALCAGAEYCALDGCRPSACEAGERRCNGYQLEQCKLDRSGWDTVQRCDVPERCDPSLTQCVVHRCADLSAIACNGGLLEKCMDGPVPGWMTLQDCGSPELCGIEVTDFEGYTYRRLNCLPSP